MIISLYGRKIFDCFPLNSEIILIRQFFELSAAPPHPTLSMFGPVCVCSANYASVALLQLTQIISEIYGLFPSKLVQNVMLRFPYH